MANRWAETFTRRTAIGASASVSVVVHAVLIGAAVVATTASGIVDLPDVPGVFVKWLAPPERIGGQEAQREQLKFVALGEPEAEVRGSRLVKAEEVRPIETRQASGLDLVTAEAAPEVESRDSVFTVIEVDSAATRYAWSAAPAYPPAMLEAKREGYVKARWVVDEGGYADTATFKLIDWTADEFAKAVRDALPFMRFSPAKMGDKSVKQLVEQEFTFRINTVVAGAGATKKP
jgi:hypothetical protein